MPAELEPANPPRRSRVLIAVGIATVVVVVIALHLTGVVDAGAH